MKMFIIIKNRFKMKKQSILLVVLFFLIIALPCYAQWTIPSNILLENQNLTGCSCPLYEASESIIIKPNTTIIPSNGPFVAKIKPNTLNGTYFSDQNYIYTKSYQIPVQLASQITAQSDIIENITYFDGLGRPMQKTAIKATPYKKDIVSHIEYDQMDRQAIDFLPYVSENNLNGSYTDGATARTNVRKQYGTYPYPAPTSFEQTNNPYSEKLFETSPLSRVLKQSAPGNDWVMNGGHEVKLDYQTNVLNEVLQYKVKKDETTGEFKLVQASNQYYDAGQLYKTITKDENWTAADGDNKTTQEFKDKEGRVVLKRTFATSIVNSVAVNTNHDTNYVYDDYDNLTYVIPPLLDRTTLISAQSIASTECLYEYDDITTITIDKTKIISDNSNLVGSGGSLFISLSGGDLSVRMDVGCYPPRLMNNLDIPIPTTATNESTNFYTLPKNLPDYNFGVINQEGYSAEIKNGHFMLYTRSNPTTTTSINQTFVFHTCKTITEFTANQPVLDNFCYQYKYDYRNRLIEKKLPGKDWEYIVYDKLDRQVLTQDANLKAQNKWLFTKYDVFNRPVYTGEYLNATQITRTDVQTLASASTTTFETKQATSATINATAIYYSNVAFPTIGTNLFTINYYDDYTFDVNGGVSEASYTITPITNAKGLATGSKVRILGTSSWTTSLLYYDAKGRPIYNYSKNDYLATTDKVKSKLDFAGKTLETTSQHTRAAITTSIVNTFAYDHVGRLLSQKQKINTQPEEVIAENVYNDLGQLIAKKVGGKTTQGRLQTVDYNYNIRGWLKNINNVNAIGNDLFTFQINYNTPTAGGTALYNGNISQTFWRTNNIDTSLKNYNYSYDAINRLTAATDNLNKYNESLSYDKNGNIMTLNRLGNTNAQATTFGTMDALTYTYATGNKLSKVEDTSGSIEGFKNGSTATIEYTYDNNGNMITDANKGINSIAYNHLNLPTLVTLAAGNINYVYDATGVKQRKIVSGTTTDYAGGFQYENNVMKFFPHPEGYAENNAGIFSYIYQYKDHLGNVRLSYGDKNNDGMVNNTEIVEENNFYPFGLKHNGYNNTITSTNAGQKLKYNGKELQDELGLNFYDYGARNYDPAIGRWMNMDEMAEKYTPTSPYNYVLNNPMYFVDPDGKDVYIYYVGPKRTWYNKPFYTLNGHTALGARPFGYRNTTYANLSGSAERTNAPNSYSNEYGYSRYINEISTIKDYVESDEVVIRMRVHLPKDVEEIIASYIATEAANGRDQGGLFCTERAKNILLVSLQEAGYSEDEAEALVDKLMWYNTPEFPTAGEMLDAGFTGADYYFKGEKGKFTHLNVDFGKSARNEEESKKKSDGLSSLLSNFQNLAAGTYTWNGSSWVKK
jgi:RHS repeat-associated protein